ncbi:SecY-interacting protein [Thorsellia kenyensis]|uniref:SecY-interacting protein n=1 Tax=Thorsellia kenyensis TaxID=1549888 RepID=A0ABV6C8W2_9GAMM
MSERVNINETVKSELINLLNRYVSAWKNTELSLPIAEGYAHLMSPCIQTNIDNEKTTWLPKIHEQLIPLAGVEKGMEMLIHQDIHTFYGIQFSADIAVLYKDIAINLIQVWNEEDHIRLQENIICHLVAQRKAKRMPSVFIGSIDDEDKIIACCNMTGRVFLESLTNGSRVYLSETIPDFLSTLTINTVKCNL